MTASSIGPAGIVHNLRPCFVPCSRTLPDLRHLWPFYQLRFCSTLSHFDSIGVESLAFKNAKFNLNMSVSFKVKKSKRNVIVLTIILNFRSFKNKFARPKIENMQMGEKRFSHEKEVTVRPIDILVAVCKCKVLHKLSSTNLKVFGIINMTCHCLLQLILML